MKKKLPETILMRRLSFEDPMNPGKEYVMFTSIMDEKIRMAEIVSKFFTRWDIEISIREIKTLMDINVVRSKKPDLVMKELLTALTAYNLMRKIIAKTTENSGFSPKEVSFKNTLRLVRQYLWTRKGEYTKDGLREEMDLLQNKILRHIIPKRLGRHFERKTKTGKYQKYV